MMYTDLYEILQDVDTPKKVEFFLEVQQSVKSKLESGRYDSSEQEGAIDDLVQFAKDMQCEGFCEFMPEEDPRDPVDYSTGSGRFQ